MKSPDAKFGVRDRLRYRFDLLLSRGTWAVLLVLGCVTLVVVVVAALLLTVSGQTFAGTDDASPMEDFWQTLLRAMDPGTMAADVGWGRRVLALLVTVFGILVVGTLIGLIASGIEQYVEAMQRGRSVVVESDHIVVLGSSPRLAVIIDQLTLASRHRGGSTIVVLADQEPRDLDDEVRSLVVDPRGSRLVFRRGDPTRRTDLALVGVARARAATIVLADEDGNDARGMSTTLAVGAELGGFDRAPIIVELHDIQRAAGLARACDGQVHPLVPSQAIARLTAFALGTPGLGLVMETLLDYGGCSIHVRPIGGLAATTFGDCVTRLEDVRPIGLLGPSGTVELNPAPDTIVGDDDRLIVMADDERAPLEMRPAVAPSSGPTAERRSLATSRKGRTLIVGWNGFGNLLVEQLIGDAAPESTVHVVYDARIFADGELGIEAARDTNTRLTPTRDDVWQPEDGSSLSACTTIILLAYRRGCTSPEADSRTLLNLMALNRALERQPGPRPRIIAELLDAEHVDLAKMSGADDCLVSDAMASRLLAQLAEQPERRNVYLQLYAPEGPSLHLVDVAAVVDEPASSWGNVVDRVYAAGFIAIGWREAVGRGGRLHMNPPTTDGLELGAGDQIVIVG